MVRTRKFNAAAIIERDLVAPMRDGSAWRQMTFSVSR